MELSYANGVKCPQHYMETLRKHGRKKPVARVDPLLVPCPTVDIPCLDSSLDSHTGHPEVREQHAPAAGTEWTCRLGERAE